VISAPECFGGYGPGCDAAASEAPIVKELLERSRANKEKNERETLETYWQNGYKSYFSFGYDRELIRADDGTYYLKRPESMIAKTLASFGIKLPSHGGLD
jgi:chromosome condensin MukBEF MukE localization factor